MRRAFIAALILTFAVIAAGCFGDGDKSRLSPDKLCAALTEYDSEEYDSREEIEDQFHNERALIAGMFARDDSGVLFVQRFDDEDGGFLDIKGELSVFENADEAQAFYDERTGENESSSDGDIQYAFIDSFRRLNAESTAVYLEGNYVFVLTGHEFKNNGYTDKISTLCELLDIPAPDISSYDCNAKLAPEERIPELKNDLNAEEISASDFDLGNVIDRQGCFYVHTDDFKDIAGVLDEERLAMYSDVIGADIFYSVDSDPGDERASRFVVMRVVCNSENEAMDFYDSMRADIAARGDASTVTLIDEGEEDGILFSKYKITDPYMSASYNLYAEGDSAYIMSFLNMDEDVAAETVNNICDILGMP
ncbi:MAG: hypothetical protein K6A80_08150 [Saccharofermentans sp.]|nr:hypothetical protein [Saccharofermentans sp.]